MDSAYLDEKVSFLYWGDLLCSQDHISNPFGLVFQKSLEYLEPILKNHSSNLEIQSYFATLGYLKSPLKISASGNFKKMIFFLDELLLSSEPGYEVIMPGAISVSRTYKKNLKIESNLIKKSSKTTKSTFDYVKKTLYSRGFEIGRELYGMDYNRIYRSNEAYKILHPKKN